MKQGRVSAFARGARLVALAAVGLALGAGSLLAQGSTGKIEGRVCDQAGAPIGNAQVFVVGTAFNALTTPQGYYFINRPFHRQGDAGQRLPAFKELNARLTKVFALGGLDLTGISTCATCSTSATCSRCSR